MSIQIHHLIQEAYSAFNSQDFDRALLAMHPDVDWPKAFEGGYVTGQQAIRAYWTRQSREINARVEPVQMTQRPNGTVEVKVYQLIKDLADNVIFDGIVKHVYTIQDGLLRRMDIELE